MLELRLFGTGQADYDGRPLAGFPQQQAGLLFCYLLLNKEYPHRREHLASVFWGDHPTHTARKCLRNTLWRLRKMLRSVGVPASKYLTISEDSVSFTNASDYWLDVETFEITTTHFQSRSSQDLSPEDVGDMEVALEIYVGDLLEGIYEEWVLYDREQLRLAYLNALNKLLIYHGSQRQYERGLECGRRILARDNTRERTHRQMMWLYCLAGDRQSALEQYVQCCQILHEELGIQPMAETRQLYQQIRRESFNPQSWPTNTEIPLITEAATSQSLHPLAKHALRRLHHLQEVIEESSAELRLVEHLITEALADSQKST